MLTLGAGEGTIIYRMLSDSGLKFYLDLVYSFILLIIIIVVAVFLLKIWNKIRIGIKEL